MFFTKIKRVIRAGFIKFWRSGVVSLSAILAMTVALFVIGALVLTSAEISSLINGVKDKIDINVYLKTDAAESDILVLKKTLENLPEVASVTYMSRDAVLADFKTRHQDNNLIIGALSELSDNPLGATLRVQAHDPNQYESVAKFLSSDAAIGPGQNTIIDKVNFSENRTVIDRLSHALNLIHQLGLVASALFVFMAVLVTVNTIRIVLYASREEIAVMKLVGASNNYTRAPFLVEGAMYGLVAAICATVLFYPVVAWISAFTGNYFGGLNLLDYYFSNLGELVILLMLSGVVMGALSSWLAVHRYLGI